MSEIQCYNKCGNLTDEGSDPYCGECKYEAKTYGIKEISKWYESTHNLSELARAISEESMTDIDSNVDAIEDYMLFLEKPWRWNEEWEWYKEHDNTMKGFDQDG